MIKSGHWILFALLFCPYLAEAQGDKSKKKENVFLHPHKFYKKYFPHLKVKRDPPDSLYIKTYPNFLSVGMHVLSPAIGVNFSPDQKAPDGHDVSSTLRTNIADIIGFSGTYRYISAGFAFLLPSGMNMHSDYASTSYRTATIKYNNAATALQFRYVRIRGFTDINRSGVKDVTMRPDMLSKDFQFEGIRNFSWRKYSYTGPLNFAQRQVKSHRGFLLKAGVYYNQLSADSAIANPQQREYYSDFSRVNVLRSLSVRLAPGIGGNLIFFRRIYFAAAVFTSADLVFYKYLERSDEPANRRTTFVFVGDAKASLGYQTKRFYAGIRYETERRFGSLHELSMTTAYTYTGLELGYRFDAPSIVKEVYRKTMPPGM